ncbi:MAG: F0F1 ATP synthase subunit delta [Atopobiaceae bacterium]|nr:F0F1 ATP synthase subunit delta [Atopobiaceae bacterium]MBQ3282902.1 F0F1 ATP synthase subunit delta [Atopobiaceae bacterium]MBR3384017.1 F0F1 ATP synthase subunit delta [Atopobiaceae bacterium]
MTSRMPSTAPLQRSILRKWVAPMPTSPNIDTVVSVTVTTAVEMDDGLRTKVREKVNELFGVGTPLFEEVDPKILGGIILEGGGRRYDASVRAQLANVRSTLASSFMGGGQ